MKRPELNEYGLLLEKLFSDAKYWQIPDYYQWENLELIYLKDSDIYLYMQEGYPKFDWGFMNELKPIPRSYRKYLYALLRKTILPEVITEQAKKDVDLMNHTMQFLKDTLNGSNKSPDASI